MNKKRIRYAVKMVIITALIYMTCVLDISGARNVLTAWVFITYTGLLILFTPDGRKVMADIIKKNNRIVPSAVTSTISTAQIMALCWFGEWLLAIPMIIFLLVPAMIGEVKE